MHKLQSIQILRALAALAVLLSHLDPGVFTIGAAGVDVFFVISGYVMGAFARGASPMGFLRQRVLRVVPLYWGVTLIMCAGALLGVFSTFGFTPEQLVKSLLFIPYRDEFGLVAPLLVVGWTLNMEMFFYLVFAGGLALKKPLLATTCALSLLAAIGLWLSPQSPLGATWTSVLLLEFLAGLLVSQANLSARGIGPLAIVLGGIGFAWASMVGVPEELARLAMWGVPAFLLVAGCVAMEKSGRWPARALRPLEGVGDASYALYLTHGLVISMVHKLLPPGGLSSMAIVVLAVAVAVVLYRLVERPMLRFFRDGRALTSLAVSPRERAGIGL